jgi:hypothetical protein
MVRDGFRTREDRTLPCGKCGKCGGETYQVPVGSWLHWGTLTEACPETVERVAEGTGDRVALERLCKPQEGRVS